MRLNVRPLAANEEIVGAGEETLYVGFKDENDVLRIRRHRGGGGPRWRP